MQLEKIYYKLDENFYRYDNLLFEGVCLEIKIPLVCDSIFCEELIAEKFISCSYICSSKRVSLNDTLICDTIITDYITYANTIIAKDIKTKYIFANSVTANVLNIMYEPKYGNSFITNLTVINKLDCNTLKIDGELTLEDRSNSTIKNIEAKRLNMGANAVLTSENMLIQHIFHHGSHIYLHGKLLKYYLIINIETYTIIFANDMITDIYGNLVHLDSIKEELKITSDYKYTDFYNKYFLFLKTVALYLPEIF